VWIPSIKAVVGGVVLFGNLRGRPIRRACNRAGLAQDARRHRRPQARHGRARPLQGRLALTPDSIGFTRDYLVTFEAETAKAANSAALIEAMKQHYPSLGLDGALETSAKVAKGEMKW
jgi:hypothetical protein